jgi:molecular chaperone DnaK
LKTIRYLEKGSEIDLINIPLLEGEQKRANRNSKIGNLLIHAKEISCDIPAGSDVEVTITMDENRLLIARAYLLKLDEEFEARFDLENEVIEKVSAKEEINKQEIRYKNIFERVENNKRLNKKIESHEINEEIDFIKNQINFINSEGDGDKKAIIKKLLNELKQKIDEVDDEVKLPILIEDAKAEIEICAKVVEDYANEKGVQYFSELRTEIEEAIQEKDLDKLEIKLNNLISLKFHLFKSDPGFWDYILEMLSTDKEKSTEPFTVQKLIDEAKEHLNNNNLNKVDRLVGRIYGYFPDDEAEVILSGYGSTVMK